MTRTIFGKVMWVGRATVFLVGLAVILALVMGVATMAFAANGSNFVLGVLTNSATAVTKLTGDVAGAEALHVSNPNTAAGSTALSLNVAPQKPPMKVNRTTRVVNLNADYLDGQDKTAFLGKTEKAADADKLDGKDSSAFAIRTDHSIESASDCDTPNTWNLCAPVTVTVPAGKTYYASVWSSFTAKTQVNMQDVAFCSAGRGPGIDAGNPCITPWGIHSSVTIEGGQLGAAASSGETIPLSEGEYTFGTAISPSLEQFVQHEAARVITKVMVRDTANSF